MSTRTVIVDAAMACIEADGWDATSMQTVRQRAGVSNGTLFHHFPSRQCLASAVVAAGLTDHQTALLQILDSSRATDDAVRRTVLRHLRWIEDHPRLARLLLSLTPDVQGLDDSARADNRAFFVAVGEWLTSRGWSGEPGLPVLVALWIGPAQEYARGRLAAPHTPLAPVGEVLADGAWHAVAPLLHQEETR